MGGPIQARSQGQESEDRREHDIGCSESGDVEVFACAEEGRKWIERPIVMWAVLEV